MRPSTDPDGDEQWRTVGTGELVESPPDTQLNPSLGKPLDDRPDFLFAREGWVGNFSREGLVGNFDMEVWVGKDGKLAATPNQRQSCSHMTVGVRCCRLFSRVLGQLILARQDKGAEKHHIIRGFGLGSVLSIC